MSGIWPDNKRKRTLDTRTGKEYRSRHQAGVAVAPECGLDPGYRPSPWYVVLKKCPGRLKDLDTDRVIGPDGNLT